MCQHLCGPRSPLSAPGCLPGLYLSQPCQSEPHSSRQALRYPPVPSGDAKEHCPLWFLGPVESKLQQAWDWSHRAALHRAATIECKSAHAGWVDRGGAWKQDAARMCEVTGMPVCVLAFCCTLKSTSGSAAERGAAHPLPPHPHSSCSNCSRLREGLGASQFSSHSTETKMPNNHKLVLGSAKGTEP